MGDMAADQLNQVVARLEAIAAQAEQAKARRNELGGEVAILKARIAELTALLEAADAKVLDAEQMAAAFDADNAKLREENKTLLESQSQAAQKIDKAMAQIEALIAA